MGHVRKKCQLSDKMQFEMFAFLRILSDVCAVKDYGPRVTVRLSHEELQKAHALMDRRGVSKISDFIRQALASELTRQAQQDQIAAFSFERLKAAIEKGEVPPAALGDVLPSSAPPSVDFAAVKDQSAFTAPTAFAKKKGARAGAGQSRSAPALPRGPSQVEAG
jgi:hypothetical protein